jgi:hypothetical protein
VSPTHNAGYSAVGTERRGEATEQRKNRHYALLPYSRRGVRWQDASVRRALVLLGAGLVTFIVAGVLLGPTSSRQDRLEQNGDRVQGVVLRAENRARGPDRVVVRYVYGGEERDLDIFGSGGSYRRGDSVAVYVDPANPDSATIPGEQPQSKPTYFLTLLVVTIAFGLAVGGAMDLWKTWRRRRAA